MGTKKKYIVGGVMVVAVVFLWWFVSSRQPEIDLSVDPDTLQTDKEYYAYYEQLAEAYKNDPYGGDTPEETMDLFIAALEAGDIELASRYFVVEKQKEMAEEFEKGNEENMDKYIDLLKNYFPPTHNEFFNTYEFYTEYENEKIFLLEVILNKQTDKWKIYES